MKTIKLFAAVALVALSAVFSSPISAQENGNKDENGKVVRGAYLTNRFIDNWFVGVAGGVNLPFFKNHETAVSAALDVNLGKWFTPCVGARLGYSGLNGSIWSPIPTELGTELNTEKNLYGANYNFAYLHADVLWNVSHAIGGYKETRLWNFIPYFHSGWVRTFSNTVDFWENELGIGVGLLNSIRVHERINITLDIRSLWASCRLHASPGSGATTNLSAALGLSVNLFRTNWTRAANWHNPEDTDKIAAAEAAAAALTAANAALAADKAKLTKENEELNAEVVELRKRPTETKAALEDVGKLVPHLHKMMGSDIEAHNNANLNKVLLFVMAIAIHNLPEGIAAGVGFGSGNTAQAMIIAGGIALQNIPEGMVIIAPMISAGVSRKKTLCIAMATGLVEVVGTLIGYFAVSLATAVLPFALAFAGGTMLYVISDEMIPETHHGDARGATYALLVGFCLMLVMDVLLG